MSKLACLAVLVAMLAPEAASAAVATGCLNTRTGQIYNVEARSDVPMKKCRKQHPQIRLQLGVADPPPSAVPSGDIIGSRTIEYGGRAELASFESEPTGATVILRYDDYQWGSEVEEPSPICQFYVFDDEVVYELARIPEGGSMSGLRSIEIFHQDDRPSGRVVNTNGTFRGGQTGWKMQVFTLEISSTRDTCSAQWEMGVEAALQ